MSGKLFIVSACSGSGKTTLVNAVIDRLKNKISIARVVTYTSRPAREGELDGKDYNFVSSDEFEEKIKENFFLEWSGEYGYYYGTPRKVVKELALGKSQILIIDRIGAKHIIEISKNPSPILTNLISSIWIRISDIAELERRLIARRKNTKEQIKKRLRLACKEWNEEKQNRLYKHHVLNDNFLNAANELEELIVRELKK